MATAIIGIIEVRNEMEIGSHTYTLRMLAYRNQ